MLLEIALYRALARWVVRRPDVPDGATAIGYSRLVAPMRWLWIFGSATEMAVVEVVLHHVDRPGRRPCGPSRSGARTRVVVPLDAVASTRPVEHERPGVVKSLHLDESLLLVGVSSRTNLELVLGAPTTVETSQGPKTATRVGLWVDEPRQVTGLLARHSRMGMRTPRS